MIGLLVLGVFLLWFLAAGAISDRIAKAIPVNRTWRRIAAVGIFLVVFLLPVADELAARPYFISLCRNAVFRINAEQIRGRKVAEAVDPSNEVISRAPIEILHSHFWYRDFATRELLAEYDVYRGRGGLLASLLAFTGTPPVTGPFLCAPKRDPPMAQEYGFTIVE
jgi:hypothetical protein